MHGNLEKRRAKEVNDLTVDLEHYQRLCADLQKRLKSSEQWKNQRVNEFTSLQKEYYHVCGDNQKYERRISSLESQNEKLASRLKQAEDQPPI